MTPREKNDRYGKMAAECLVMAKLVANPGDQAFLLALTFRWHVLGVESDGSSDGAAREAQALIESFGLRFH
jgi:hypothetical protein